ncbi:unnamed protein product [Toxocara canis]|uniref:Uncharacterized protein n=1 Tax=Toxocara canis TaxID=6265 RepID=A0A183TWG1_TOXCA|nr:unnamed protein product [Toxocara canis]
MIVQILRAIKCLLRTTQIQLALKFSKTVGLEGPATTCDLDLAEIPRNSRDFEPTWIPPANIEGRGSVAIRESDRNDLTVLSGKKKPAAIRKFNRSASLTQSESQRFIRR